MIDKHIKAFELPRITLTGKWDFELKEVLKAMEDAQVYFTAFQNGRGELKVIHSEINEEMYAMLQTTLHRDIGVHDLLKLSLINIELFRNGEMNEAFELMTRAVEYINIKNSKVVNL
jgi:hypothetical protein